MSTSKPTYIGFAGQVDKWTAYRLTTDYRMWMKEIFRDVDCVCGFETSTKGVRHFHVMVKGDDQKEAIAKRIQRKYTGKDKVKKLWWSKVWVTGNVEGKTWEKGVAYTVKCGDIECFGDITPEYVASVPQWIFPVKLGQDTLDPKEENKKDRDWQLTYSNVVCQAVRHAKRFKLAKESMKQVVQHMLKTTKWRPCKQMYACGIMRHFEDDFEFRMGRGGDEPAMGWWVPSER